MTVAKVPSKAVVWQNFILKNHFNISAGKFTQNSPNGAATNKDFVKL